VRFLRACGDGIELGGWHAAAHRITDSPSINRQHFVVPVRLVCTRCKRSRCAAARLAVLLRLPSVQLPEGGGSLYCDGSPLSMRRSTTVLVGGMTRNYTP
jgi:hypothetical protein